MTMLEILNLLKELGVLNILGVLFILNTPAILFITYMAVTMRTHVQDTYMPKAEHKETLEPLRADLSALRKSINSLTQAINEQHTKTEVHEERFKTLGTRPPQAA